MLTRQRDMPYEQHPVDARHQEADSTNMPSVFRYRRVLPDDQTHFACSRWFVSVV